ncbi:unnamed protein product [Choristocarpus tenellus]
MLQFEMDCNEGKGNVVACHQVGEFLSVVKNEKDKAAAFFDRNCAAGYAPSCFNYGRAQLTGKGALQSDSEALKSFERACEGDHRPACYHLGYMLLYGAEGVDRDSEKAFDSLQKSCDGGLSDGCYLKATQLLRKDGKGPVPRDPIQARELLEKSCDFHHGPSCFNLAVMYKHGDIGVPRDEDKFDVYKKRTEELVDQMGGLSGTKAA